MIISKLETVDNVKGIDPIICAMLEDLIDQNTIELVLNLHTYAFDGEAMNNIG